MKKIIFFLVVYIGIMESAYGLNASLNHAVFAQGDKNIVELSLNITGKSVKHLPTPDSLHLQASLNVVYLFKQGDKIVQFDKFSLNGPKSPIALNFFDIKRYSLPTGKYRLEATVSDANDVAIPLSFALDIEVLFDNTKVQQSDIQLIKSVFADSSNSAYAKNGYLMEPAESSFFDKNTSVMYIYQELYNTQLLGDAFALSYSIFEDKTNPRKVPVLVGHKKFRPSATPHVFLGNIDITKLPSGNYKLYIELRNRNKELISSKMTTFQRANPYLNVELTGVSAEAIEEEFVAQMNREELKYALRAIACKMRGEESKDLNEIVKVADEKAMRLRLFRYWAAKSPNQPQEAYEKYMGIARAVDNMYRSGFGFGFETDRGYVYMKYGRPDDIVEQHSNPDTAPYEIWVYYDFPLTGQKNIKFIYYDAEGSGSMRLLNTTARGELQDPQWRRKLYKNTPDQLTGDGFGPAGIQDNFNRNADKLLEDW